MTENDKMAATLLEKLGNLTGEIAAMFGARGVLAGAAVKAITHGAAMAIRHRGATTDEIVQSLRKIGRLETPWQDSKVTGKDPA